MGPPAQVTFQHTLHLTRGGPSSLPSSEKRQSPGHRPCWPVFVSSDSRLHPDCISSCDVAPDTLPWDGLRPGHRGVQSSKPTGDVRARCLRRVTNAIGRSVCCSTSAKILQISLSYNHFTLGLLTPALCNAGATTTSPQSAVRTRHTCCCRQKGEATQAPPGHVDNAAE